ncbi:MAG TPA: GNAT family N-acetyltransferase [Actinomycetes bacterium]|nr:GNAT family N-acetyltransferase [Actinomycetes bacterium]
MQLTRPALRRLDPLDLDPADLAGGLAVLEAARRVDAPHTLPLTARVWTVDLTDGWDGEPSTVYLHRDNRGRAVAVLEVYLPHRDNRHVAEVYVSVDPAVRRQGLGRALFQVGLDQARAAGRTAVWAEGFDTDASRGFAAHLGLQKAITSVNRRQVMHDVDLDDVAGVVTDATAHARDYELLRLTGPVPDDLMDQMVVLVASINDAPMDDLEFEDEVFSPERLRSFDSALVAKGGRLYRLVARHRATGVLAGHTIVAVDEDRPWHGGQLDTSVLAEHRGHRLGLLLKGTMVQWLAEAEPQLLEVDTWNAASNAHMIAVNDRLGYQVVATATCYQTHI